MKSRGVPGSFGCTVAGNHRQHIFGPSGSNSNIDCSDREKRLDMRTSLRKLRLDVSRGVPIPGSEPIPRDDFVRH